MERRGVCILPRVEGLGGPASFRARLIAALTERGVPVYDRFSAGDCAAVLVIAGTRRLGELLEAKRRGVRIVQRLDGMNWVHRKRPTPLRRYLRAELGNRLLSFTRRFLADQVVYQSQFARQWWQTVYGGVRAPGRVIYNGVDLRAFSPDGPHDRPVDHIRLLLVEGNLAGGNEQGLINAVRLADAPGRQADQKAELVVAGNAPAEMRAEIERDYAGGLWVRWAGVLAREDIPHLDRSAHLMFSADLNAACPNSVIEALACGLPVIGYATGSLPELIDEDAGRVVPYGANYWNLEQPEIEPLVAAAIEVINEQDCFRQAARRRAELVFSIERVVDQYLDVLLG